MIHYKYLVIGGGMTAGAALNGIREIDRDGTIGVISQEIHKPYFRPPLSKGTWFGQKNENEIKCHVPADVTFHLGRRARSLDPTIEQVTDDTGETYSYERLLLATGGSPRHLDTGGEDIIYFRTLDDYRRLIDLQSRLDRFAIIGGGFIGSEIAASLAMRGKQVHMIFPESRIVAMSFCEPRSCIGRLSS